MGGQRKTQAVAAAETEIAAEKEVEADAEAGAVSKTETPAWVQTKAPPKTPTKASTKAPPARARGKKQARAPPAVPSPMQVVLENLALTISVDDAAEVLGISRHVAYQAVKEGEIPSIRVRRVIRVPTAALRAMLLIEAREAAE
jgi:excisionase family DNA binding protein